MDYRYGDGDGRLDPSDLSTKELLSELREQGRRMVREELKLVRAELRELWGDAEGRLRRDVSLASTELRREVHRATSGTRDVAIGGVIAHAGLYLLLLALVFGLAAAMPLWLSFLLVGAATAIAGAFLARGGLAKMRGLSFKPKATLARIGEDKRWMTERLHAVRSRTRASA